MANSDFNSVMGFSHSAVIAYKQGQWIFSKLSHISPIKLIFGGGQDKYAIFN